MWHHYAQSHMNHQESIRQAKANAIKLFPITSKNQVKIQFWKKKIIKIKTTRVTGLLKHELHHNYISIRGGCSHLITRFQLRLSFMTQLPLSSPPHNWLEWSFFFTVGGRRKLHRYLHEIINASFQQQVLFFRWCI